MDTHRIIITLALAALVLFAPDLVHARDGQVESNAGRDPRELERVDRTAMQARLREAVAILEELGSATPITDVIEAYKKLPADLQRALDVHQGKENWKTLVLRDAADSFSALAETIRRQCRGLVKVGTRVGDLAKILGEIAETDRKRIDDLKASIADERATLAKAKERIRELCFEYVESGRDITLRGRIVAEREMIEAQEAALEMAEMFLPSEERLGGLLGQKIADLDYLRRCLLGVREGLLRRATGIGRNANHLTGLSYKIEILEGIGKRDFLAGQAAQLEELRRLSANTSKALGKIRDAVTGAVGLDRPERRAEGDSSLEAWIRRQAGGANGEKKPADGEAPAKAAEGEKPDSVRTLGGFLNLLGKGDR